MALRTLVISSYPPDRCGIAKYTVQYAAAQRRSGRHVEVVSSKPSAAQHHVDMRSWRGVLAVLFLTYRYDEAVVQFFPDLLFSSLYKRQFLPHLPFVALLFGLGHNVRVVVHEAPYPELIGWPGFRGRIMRALWRVLFTLPRQTVVHTEWERDQLVAATGIAASRIEIVPPGATYVPRAHADRETARAALGLEPDCYHFLSIGFIQPHKGFDRALKAFRRLQGDKLRLHVVGSMRVDDPEVSRHVMQLEELAEQIPGARLHVGFVTDEEFDRWIVASDAVVLPYRKIVSSAVLERVKLYERPAVVSDVGGMPHQASGTTLVVSDDEELAQAMARLAGVELRPGQVEGGPEDASPEAARERIQRSAARLREIYEHAGGAGANGEPTAVVTSALPSGRTRTRTLAKRAVSRLTVWQLQPLVKATNDLRTAVIEDRGRVAALEAELAGTKHWLELKLAELNGAIERQAQASAHDREEVLSAIKSMGRPDRESGS